MNLSGKNLVYVGGTGGIGLETCKQLMRKNLAHLVVLDKIVNPDAIAELKSINSKVQVHYWNYDVTMDVENMRQIFIQILSEIHGIDILVNGAGICNEREINNVIAINLIGGINTTVVAFEHMDKRTGGKGGVIINIGSVAGLNGFPTLPVYSATKAGVISFATSIAQLEPITGIKAFAVCPGITRTPILHTMHTFMGIDDTLSAKIAKLTVQTPEEYAKNFIAVLEECKNGAIWLLDNNDKTLIEIPTYWEAPKELL